MSNATRVETTREKVMVELLKSSDYQKEGSLTAQLRQKVTRVSYYPGKQANNSFTNSVFDSSDFGDNYKEQPFSSIENRVAFLNVPVGQTVQSVQEKIDQHKDACLYRILSNHPILSTSQEYAIKNGQITKDKIANSQVTRYGEGTVEAGQLVLDGLGKPQYRAVFFSSTHVDDIDLRTDDPNDFYESPEIRMELTGELMQEEFTLDNGFEGPAEGQTL